MLGILAQMEWSQWFLAVLLIFVCCFLMLVILLQRGRGSGLAGAFGGGGGSSAFGAKTGDVFTWITVIIAAIFLLGNVLGNYAFDQSPEPPQAADTTQATPVGAGTPIQVTPVEVPPLPTGEGETGEAESGGTPAGTAPATPPAGTQPGAGEPYTSESGKPAPTEGTGGQKDDSTP